MSAKRNFRCPATHPPFNSCSAAIPALFAIVRLSLIVSLSAVALAALIGMPLGALHRADAISRPRGASSCCSTR